MKIFAIFCLFFIIQNFNPVCSTLKFSPPDFSNAIDAIDQPKYQQVLLNLYGDEQPLTRHRKIINGEASRLGDFPYQVLLYMTANNINWYTCGGVLVHREWVITAGHCVTDYVYYELFFGLIQRPGSEFGWMTTVTESGDVHLHEKYNDITLANDIGMIFLAESPENLLEFPNIGVVALPRTTDSQIDLFGVIASISGFGRTTDGGSPSNILMNATAPITSNSLCAEVFAPYILPSNLCLNTSNNAGSSCRGDSGGPATAEIEPNRRVLVGIVSFGAAAGCSLGYPDVYTRVTSYIDWINERINPSPPNDRNCNCVCNCFTCPASI